MPSDTRELLERLNRLWHVAGAPPSGGTMPGTLLYQVRLMLARVLAPQETFNAAVVEYLNTTWNALEQARIATDEAIRYRESLAARERRIETAMKAIVEAHQEIRTAIGQLQQSTHALKREVNRLESEPGTSPSRTAAPEPSATATRVPAPSSAPAYESALDAHQYVGFEDQFRGSSDDIRSRLEDYLPLFSGRQGVLELGCGRGEFLALLQEHGVSGRGVDVNPAMVEASRARALEVSQGDALTHLTAAPDGSLGGLFAAQVVEHLQPGYLIRLLESAFAKLQPGAPIVLETINPACWFAFFSSYIRDITHVQPLHPDTLKYLLVAAGFQRVEIRYRTPYPEQHKLQPVAVMAPHIEWAATLNENADKLNRLLFTHLDYAAIGYRP